METREGGGDVGESNVSIEPETVREKRRVTDHNEGVQKNTNYIYIYILIDITLGHGQFGFPEPFLFARFHFQLHRRRRNYHVFPAHSCVSTGDGDAFQRGNSRKNNCPAGVSRAVDGVRRYLYTVGWDTYDTAAVYCRQTGEATTCESGEHPDDGDDELRVTEIRPSYMSPSAVAAAAAAAVVRCTVRYADAPRPVGTGP